MSAEEARSQFLMRQKSDSSFDRSRPLISRRLRYDSESEENNNSLRVAPTAYSKSLHHSSASNNSIDSFYNSGGGFGSQPGLDR
jgi:hypothetical protein